MMSWLLERLFYVLVEVIEILYKIPNIWRK